MDLSDADLQQLAAADRRAVDRPIQVETATWSKAGKLDWWVKERQEWLGRVRGATAVNGGSELLIFVRPKNDASRGIFARSGDRRRPARVARAIERHYERPLVGQ